jgi:RNA polymerase sigma factor (TIGR02999 family)
MDARNSSETLLESAYDELRLLARRKLASERPNHTLQATALVHEVYCRLSKQSEKAFWQGPDHFLAAAVEAMRRILVDHARRKLAAKRGGHYSRLSLESLAIELPMDADDLLDVHEALNRLAEEDPLAAELVKLRVFGGFSHIDAAGRLGMTKSKGDRVWAYAKARLYVLMGGNRTASTGFQNA